MRHVHHPGEADPRSILVILPTWVGDFVMATPTLRAVRTRFADARITFLIEPNLVELARGGDWMDELIEWPGKDRRSPLHKEYRRVVAQLRHRRFDWAVLLSNSFRSALIARLAGIKRRIGYDRDGRGLLLTDRLPVKNRRGRGKAQSSFILHPSSFVPAPPGRFTPMPLVEYLADLAEAIGCERPGHRLELFVTPDCDSAVEQRLTSLGMADHRPLVVIAPGAKYGASKCWPVERFAAVADRLIENEKAAVVVACGPGEESLARELGSAIRAHGKPPLPIEGEGGPAPLPLSPEGRGVLASLASLEGRGVLDGGAQSCASDYAAGPRGLNPAARAEGVGPSPLPLSLEGRGVLPVPLSPGGGGVLAPPVSLEGRGVLERKLTGKWFIFDSPRLTLGELKSLVKRSDLLLCNDTGPRHLAKAFEVPVVTVFGPTHPEWTATDYEAERIVRIDADCGPCQQRVCPLGHLKCMTGVTIDAVYEAARELLRSRVAHSELQTR